MANVEADAASRGGACRNCGAPLHGDWCSDCGQRRLSEEDRRFGKLLGDLVKSLTSLDGRLWSSLRALLFRPGKLSRDWLEGRRARWMSPATLFLLANLLYFFFPALTDFSLRFVDQVPGHLVIAAHPDPVALSADAREFLAGWRGQIHSPVTAVWVERRVERRNAAAQAASDGRRGYSMVDYARDYDAAADGVAKALIVLHVPFMALGLMALYRASGLYYAEHFVTALHLFTFLVLFMQVVILPGSLVVLLLERLGLEGGRALGALAGTAFALAVLAYVTLALREVYQGPLWRAALSAAVLLGVLLVTHAVVYRSLLFGLTFAVT